MVHWGEGWPASEDEEDQEQLIGGRQAEEGAQHPPQKRKLERHFLDRGVWASVGVMRMDHVSNAVFSDLEESQTGWPQCVSLLCSYLPFTTRLHVVK